MDEPGFHWADYLVLGISLFLSCAVGVYYGIMDRKWKRNTTEDFLMAGRTMSILPVAVSMVATIMSAISILGNPVELYYFGVVYWVLTLGNILALPIVAHFVAPVFYKLKVVSANQVRFCTPFLRNFLAYISPNHMIYVAISFPPCCFHLTCHPPWGHIS